MADLYEFNVQVNIGDVAPVSVLMQSLSPGAHKVRVADAFLHQAEKENEKSTFRFLLIDEEEGSTTLGAQTQISIGTDMEKGNRFNARLLKTSLISVGAKAELIKGVLTLSPTHWKGRTAYVYVKPAAEGETDDQVRPGLPDTKFMTPQEYVTAKQLAAQLHAAGATATGAQTPTTVTRPPQPTQPTTTVAPSSPGTTLVTGPTTPQNPTPTSTPTINANAQPAQNLDGLFG